MQEVFFRGRGSWLTAMEQLGDGERGRLFTAVLLYCTAGEAGELAGNERYIWPTIRAQLDQDAAELDKKHRTFSEAGKAGAKAKQARLSQAKPGQARPSQATERIEKETEREREKERSKERERERDREKDKRDYITPPPPKAAELPTFGPELESAVQDWLAYKRERRETYKPVGLKSLMTQITNRASQHGEAAVAQVIRDSMASGYAGIVFDRLDMPAVARPGGKLAPSPTLGATRPQPGKAGEADQRARQDMERLRELMKRHD